MKIVKILLIQIILIGCFTISNPIPTKAIDVYYTPQVQIDGTPSGKVEGDFIAKYIIGIVKYANGIIMMLAIIVMMYGGVRWLTAMGSADAIGDAKNWIFASISGLALALCSFLILATINTGLTSFEKLKITPAGKADISTASQSDKVVGCCLYKNQSGTIQTGYSKCEYKEKFYCKNDSGYYAMVENKKCEEVSGCSQYGKGDECLKTGQDCDAGIWGINAEKCCSGKCVTTNRFFQAFGSSVGRCP